MELGMFWNSVNLIRPKSWSLVTKLMVLYAISTIAVLFSISIFLYPTFLDIISHINVTFYNYLEDICYKKIVAALLLSSLVAILLGYIIARNSMSRVHEFANKIELITANSLHERINLNDWPCELKTLGNKFNNMLDRLQLSFTQLSQFSSDIAHELRNPIHNLKGMTEQALTKTRTVDEYNQLLESCYEEYEYLTKLIENLFFLAHVDHGEIKINKIELNAREEILKICDYFSAIAAEKNIEITCAGNATILADPILFKRVVNNLLSNALKYTPSSGKIHIDLNSVKDNVHLTFKDTGVGIQQAHLSKIFDRFYRVDPSRSSLTGGLGLGLTIAKSIIELHKGQISIESEFNKGTTINIKLPK